MTDDRLATEARTPKDLREYWDRFYSVDHPSIEAPSPFARHCLSHLWPGATLLEIGCGNGRDAIFFAGCGLRVLACDASPVAIDHVRERATARSDIPAPPELFVATMSSLDSREIAPVDAVYMRFVLHAVPREEASRAIAWAGDHLAEGSMILIEARSVKGDLYGRGIPLGDDAFEQDGHYRRFIRLDELSNELEASGFRLEELVEAKGLAAFGNDDPVVIRAVGRRAAGR